MNREKGAGARLGFATSEGDCESECVDWLSKGGVVGGFNSRGRLTPLKGGRLEGWRGRETQSDKEMGAGAFREAQKKFPNLSQRICFPFISLYF